MGNLYIVATPIGNLQDITLRAIEVLKKAEFIACEDTRRAHQLLKVIGATHNSTLISYYEQNELERIPQIINLLVNGKDVVLISDAGTPMISDPGFKLVRSCVEQGIQVQSIPGPSAVTAALALSGLPTDKFLFIGYLPEKPGHRKTFLQQLENIVTIEEKIHPTVIMFVAPHKLIQTLTDMKEIFEDMEIVIARELTKIHEEVFRGKISESIEKFTKIPPKGEFTILFNLFVQDRSPIAKSGRVE